MSARLDQRIARAAPRFPAATFASKLDFDNYLAANRVTLDATFLHERRFATAEPTLVTRGTCAPCMRPATFTSRLEGGEVLPNGMAVPNWREGFVCDCVDRLNGRLRATLHFLVSVTGISTQTPLLELGPPTQLEPRLATMARLMPRHTHLLDDGTTFRLPVPSRSAAVVLSLDALHLMPPLDDALAEIWRVLMPGGQFVFTAPFRVAKAATVTHERASARAGDRPLPIEPDEVHELAWDLFDRLRSAGFRRPLAHAYRSEELGYYGLFNMIFCADA